VGRGGDHSHHIVHLGPAAGRWRVWVDEEVGVGWTQGLQALRQQVAARAGRAGSRQAAKSASHTAGQQPCPCPPTSRTLSPAWSCRPGWWCQTRCQRSARGCLVLGVGSSHQQGG
jgi:hypothetical protein